MKSAIAIVGATLSGKSALLEPYAGQVIRRPCMRSPSQEENGFDLRRLQQHLLAVSLPDNPYFLLDGFPQTCEEFCIVSDFFQFRGFIEVHIPEPVWNNRLMTGQTHPPYLREYRRLEKAYYEHHIVPLRNSHYAWMRLTNTGTLPEMRSWMSLDIRALA